jgi:hypothetical protein
VTGQEQGHGGERRVTFGLFDWLDRGDGALADLYEERLALVEYADRAGYY